MPKGCVVTMASLASYCHAKAQAHSTGENSVVFLASAVTFDPYLGDVLATWASGGCLCAVPRQSMLSSLGEALRDLRATHVLTTPTLFSTLQGRFGPSELPHLGCVALGGEVMPR